ncbi:MAG TPA: YciI family protein [Gemmatimonadales bacterium]|jgi:hypothetical protein
MRFLTIVSSVEDQGHPPEALAGAMQVYIQESLATGVLVQTGGLGPSSQGARLKLNNGVLTVTDGPFAETKEILGGYAIIDVPSREAALEAARQFMDLHHLHWPTWNGTCEVRELVFLAP